MLTDIQVVLSHTSHPGNIGATARAMKTMALTSLVLVNPKEYPHADATARASGADDLLATARVCGDIDMAVADCQLVIGASARSRSIPCPVISPAECARLAFAASQTGKVAILFGCEQSGLSNLEIDRCHKLVQIPTNPDYSSLNLAAAVQTGFPVAAFDPGGGNVLFGRVGVSLEAASQPVVVEPSRLIQVEPSSE